MTTAEHGHAHSPHLAHHFDTPQQQFDSGKLGMWLFLATEILLFGGLFCAYAIYRSSHPEIFTYAHQFLDKKLGGINTIVLICSSLTMATAVRCAQLGKRTWLIVNLFLTLACAGGFMGIKYIEYSHKIHAGLLWGTHFAPHDLHGEHGGGEASHVPAADVPATTIPATSADAAAPSAGSAPVPAAKTAGAERSLFPDAAAAPAGLAPPTGAEGHGGGVIPKNVQIFFGIYFAMTGLHGIHVLAGMITITWLIVGAFKGRFGPAYFTPVDLVGLYWHIVDLIWIFLFPLLYLIH